MRQSLNFTKAAIDSLPVPQSGNRVTYHDSKINGLQLRITSSGIKTFCVFKWVKNEGKPERFTLGRYPDLSIEQARTKAQQINAAIASGENPNNVIREAKAEMTLGDLFDLYLERWAKPHKKTWKGDDSNFEIYFKRRTKLATRKLSSVNKAQIATLHAEISKTAPISANRVLALVSSIYGWARQQGIWEGNNPVQGIRKNPEKSRERFIQSEELPVFFEALAMEPNEMLQDYFMLLLLTGVRRSNLLAMRWQEISFDRKEWNIPDTKNGTPQIISLDDGEGTMMRILENRKSKTGKSPWVFPSDGVTGHLIEPRKCWERILARGELLQLISLIGMHEKWDVDHIQKLKQEAAKNVVPLLDHYFTQAKELELDTSVLGLRNLRIHDLRRTLGSWMACTGATTVIIGRQLNQKSASATAVYARLQQDPVKEARNKAVTAMFAQKDLPKMETVNETN